MKKLYFLLFAVFFQLMAFSQQVAIGTGTNNSSNSPWNAFYGYSYVQTLYLESEIAASGSITTVQFYYAGTALGNSDSIDMYMGVTPKTSFANTADWIPVGSLTPVFSGLLTGYSLPGWVTVTLTTPFPYSGSGNLVIAVDENKDNYDGSTRFQGTTLAGSNRVLAYSSDTNNPDPAAPPAGTRSNIVGNILIDGLTLSTCQPVTGVMASNIMQTSVQLDWTVPAITPAAYDIYVSTSSTAPSGTTTPTVAGVTNNTYNLTTGLSPSTQYYVFVRSNCGGGTVSAWSASASFVTACVAVTSFSENFDLVTTPALPTCWSSILRGSTLSTFASVTTATGTVYSTPNAVNLYNSSSTSTDDIILVSPPVSNLAVGTYQLTFYARTSTLGEDIEIGTLDNNSSTGTFTSLENVPLTTTFQKYTVSFASYQGADMYIGMRRLNTNTYSNVYIDNVVWQPIPSCSEPTTLMVSNISMAGAQIDWMAPVAGSPASYDVYYSSTNTAPTSATTPSIAGLAATTVTLTGLASASPYFVWVRSNCGSGGLSQWSVADSFYTTCNAVNVPYTENFETATIPALPNCTSNENVGTGNNWVTINNPGNGFTSNTLKYGYNFTNPADAWFYTRGLNLTSGTSYRLSFKYGNNSTTYVESMNVNYGTSPSSGSMTDLIVDYPTITGGTPTTSETDFTPSATGVYYIGFHVSSIANQYNLYVDDIAVTVTPTCDAPTTLMASNITQSGAQIDWSAPAAGSPASYDLYYSTSNIAPADTATPSVSGITATTYTFTTLLSATQYFVWIRSNCGSGGVSSWSVADSFYTSCSATGVPYTENFETAPIPGLPNCTSSENVGTGNNWVTINNPGNGFTSNTLEYVYNGTNPADAWFYTRGLNLTAGTSYRLSFKYGNNSTTYVESMNVSYGTSASSGSMTDLIVDYPTITGGTPATSETDFTPSATGVYYIGFHVSSIADQYNLYVDDITVAVTPLCSAPTALVVSNIGTNDAQIDWTAPASSPASYDVYYSISNVAPDSSTIPNISGVASTTVNVTGLLASSTYYVWVRSNCGGSGNSAWSQMVSFATLCGVITAPSAAPETFASVIPACWSKAKGILADPSTSFTSTTASNWTIDDFGNRTSTLNKAARLNIWTTTTNDWLITPSYDLGATGGNYQLEFDLAYTPYSDSITATLGVDDKFAVVISTDNGATWSLANALRTWDATTPISNNGEHITIDLASYTGTVMFAFYGESTISNADNNVYIDNMEVTQGAMPVTLLNFKGERQGSVNLLTWKTASEQNNKGFELQRSSNGENFSTIGFVKTKSLNGSSTSLLSYNFSDEKPFVGNSYYRLKQVDNDGRSTLSNIVLIKGVKVNSIVLSSVYPNPAKNQLNVVLSSPSVDKVSLVVTDLAGKIVRQEAAQLVNGDNNLKLNVSGLPSGSYILKMVCNNGCEAAVSKFVKQ